MRLSFHRDISMVVIQYIVGWRPGHFARQTQFPFMIIADISAKLAEEYDRINELRRTGFRSSFMAMPEKLLCWWLHSVRTGDFSFDCRMQSRGHSQFVW